ncbi:MAG: DEAD/DEAH box helicase [Myxococcales bacterium]|nr:DEAD/DEAH box helicase [Myxococcales bacterium]
MQYRGLTLDPFQETAIDALHRGHNVLVSAPTGTGKTIIADWIVDEALQTGKRVVYTAPIKALSNQKFRDYCRLYGEDRVGLVTGDMVIRRDAPCLVMTTEILRNMLLQGDAIEDLLAVVIDEIHFLDDRERGTVWEEVLIYLPKEVRIVGLSATLSNLEDLGAWLEHVRQHPIEVVTEHERAVPLLFHYLSSDTGLCDPVRYERLCKKKQQTRPRGRGRGADDRRGKRTTHLDAFRRLSEHDLLPYLYFVFSRRDTELHARALFRQVVERHGSLLDADAQQRSRERLVRAAERLGPVLDDELFRMYAAGVGFHHAGLHVELKTLVEELYEDRLIQVLYCTSTFALGINMPARSVVFDGIEKFDGQQVAPLTTRGFMQKAGRAGRRGMDQVGHVIVRVDPWEYQRLKPFLEKYARAGYEPVRSAFNLSFHSIVHLIERLPPERIRELVERSFLAWNLERAASRQHGAMVESKGRRRGAHKAERLRNRTWDELQNKIAFLVDIGYLDDDHTFQAGAKVLRHLQISEVFVTELVLDGVLEDLDGSTVFGICCGLTNNLPRHAHPTFRVPQEARPLARRIDRVRNTEVVQAAAELSGGGEVLWDPDVMVLGRMWAEGTDLLTLVSQIRSDTDISGDLITGFRRAKDLLGQLVDVYADLPDRATILKQTLRRVSRDEVEVVG